MLPEEAPVRAESFVVDARAHHIAHVKVAVAACGNRIGIKFAQNFRGNVADIFLCQRGEEGHGQSRIFGPRQEVGYRGMIAVSQLQIADSLVR